MDGRTEGPTDRPLHRDARTHLKSVSETSPSRRAGFLALRSKRLKVGKLSYILVKFLVFYNSFLHFLVFFSDLIHSRFK